MGLHPDIARALVEAGPLPPPPGNITELRARARDLYINDSNNSPVRCVENIIVPGNGIDIPVRIYHPEEQSPQTAIVYYHGGGFCTHDLDTHEAICRFLCANSASVVIAVDYRRAPEAQFPTPVLDCVSVAKWAHAGPQEINITQPKLILSGDSAGGNLAVVTAAALQEAGYAVAGQLLFYPMMDHYSAGWPSYLSKAEGYGVTSAWLSWFWDQYCGVCDDYSNAQLSPLRAADFTGVPRTYVQVAEFDPLKDEGEAYAARLLASNRDVTLRCAAGLIHGYLRSLGSIEEVSALLLDACSWVRSTSRD